MSRYCLGFTLACFFSFVRSSQRPSRGWRGLVWGFLGDTEVERVGRRTLGWVFIVPVLFFSMGVWVVLERCVAFGKVRFHFV